MRVAQIGVTGQSYYHWRKEYGGLKRDQARRMKELEKENARLRRAVSDLTLDKLIMQEAYLGNFWAPRADDAVSIALTLLRKLFNNQGEPPEQVVTGGLASYRATTKIIGCRDKPCPGQLRDNNRGENSHLPVRRRERKMQHFKSQDQAQRFVSARSAIYNTFAIPRHLDSHKTMCSFRMEPCVRDGCIKSGG